MDVIDLDAMVEESWRTFEENYAIALGQLRPGQYLRATYNDGDLEDEDEDEDDEDGGEAQQWVYGNPAVLTYAWGDAVGVIVEGNDVLACSYRLTRADMAALRKCGLRRFHRSSSAYRLVLPASEAMQAARVAASVLRDVFSVVHPAFLVGGGFEVCGQPRRDM